MKYFSISEFEQSPTAQRKGIDNTVKDNAVKKNIVVLVENLLDPLRAKWGRPLHINSGYRSPALNRAVGGSPTSQHCKGQAADLDTGSIADNKRLFAFIINNFDFDQIINENNYKWVHVSFNLGHNRRQQLKINK